MGNNEGPCVYKCYCSFVGIFISVCVCDMFLLGTYVVVMKHNRRKMLVICLFLVALLQLNHAVSLLGNHNYILEGYWLISFHE